MELSSPFTLFPAIKFAVFFAVIIALVKLADYYFSSQGVYIISFLSGFASVDAITLSLSQLSADSLPLNLARNGILVAILTNIVVKGGIAYWFGTPKFGKLVLMALIPIIVVGILMMIIW